MDVVVIVPCFGQEYVDLSSRAIRSVPTHIRTIIRHGKTLAEARNRGASELAGKWLCFLDADDELEENYFAEMACMEGFSDTFDVIVPNIRVICPTEPIPQFSQQIPPCNLLERNWCVVSSLIRRSYFEKVAGFREMPFWEDWDLFIRLKIAGARFVSCPAAVLRIHRREDSRNNNLTKTQIGSQMTEFRELYGQKLMATYQ